MVEQTPVDGDGSESGGCNLAQVTPSTELQECAIQKWEDLMTWVEPVASMVVASMASSGVEWWRRLVVTGVFDAEGTDVEVPSVSPVARVTRTV